MTPVSHLFSHSQSTNSTLDAHFIELISFFFSFFSPLSIALILLTQACYLIKEPAMGFDGILTSVFIPRKISPDTNLMKKKTLRTVKIRR